MPLYAFEGHRPEVHPDAWVAPTATLIGDVTVEAGASIWFGAILRGDMGRIVVRKGANVQDGSVIHTGPDLYAEIGENVTIGHLCVVHGAVVGAQALIANGTTILDGVRIGARSLVAAGSLVAPNTEIPPESFVVGAPARVRGPLSEDHVVWIERNAPGYHELTARYRTGFDGTDLAASS